MKQKGTLIVISGPSGSGKGTVVNILKKNSAYALSISATTRSPRPGEIDGVHYFFKTEDEFKEMIDKKCFDIEDSTFFDFIKKLRGRGLVKLL